MLERVRHRVGRWVRRDAGETSPHTLLFADHDEIQDIARQMTRTKVQLERSVLALRSWARDLDRRLTVSQLALGPHDELRTLGETVGGFAHNLDSVAGMQAKAESFKQYNEAAVIEMIVRVLPEVAGRISEPLSKTEKMVIINSGNGPGGGASKLTGDVTQIIAQLPPVLESLTGVKFEKLLEQVPALKNAMRKAGEEK